MHAERGGAYRALVNLEVREQLAPVRILGQHADDRLLDDALGDARLQLLVRLDLHAAGPAAVPPVVLVLRLSLIHI